MQDCVVVIEARSSTDGLLETVNSILSQRGEAIAEIVVTVSERSTAGPESRIQLTLAPWVAHSSVVTTASGGFEARVLEGSKADFFFLMGPGDVLLPGAIERIRHAFLAAGCGVVLAPCRWSDGTETWSEPGVERLFEATTNPQFRLEGFRQLLQDGSIPCYRSNLLSSGERRISVPCAVVRDYLIRKRDVGIQQEHRAYPVSIDRIPDHERVNLIPFPGISERHAKKDKGAWLFGERRGYGAGDNAWALFKYCRARLPEHECYFVLESGADVPIPAKYRADIVYKGSTRWKTALQKASHIFFTDTAEDVLADNVEPLSRQNLNYIYLTHGYLAHSPGVYQRGLHYIDRVVCSSLEEVDTASTEWGIGIDRFLRTGMPRWDLLHPGLANGTEILFLPTWRKSFDSLFWSEASGPASDDLEKFKNSVYFKEVTEFLGDPRLEAFLQEYDATLSVNLHFRFARFLPAFDELASERIRIVDPTRDQRPVAQMLQNACALITDYSSIMWDMVYMDKPVVCYQFEKPAMLAEREREQFTLPDHELPLDICYRLGSVFEALSHMASRGFKLKSRHRVIRERLIPLRDGNARQRLVDALLDDASSQPREFGLAEPIRPPTLFFSELDRPELRSPRTAAIIRGGSHTSDFCHRQLDPRSWREQLADPHIERVIVEPHMAAQSIWADLFFNPRATLGFLTEIAGLARELGLESELWLPAPLPYKDMLRDVAHEFDRVRKTRIETGRPPEFDISVIIPVFNGAQSIGACIDSLLGQRFAGSIEIIVVDDGSTDETPTVLEAYAAENPNIVVVRQQNARQGMARNRGIAAARGEFVMFLDADDRLPFNAVSTLHFACLREQTDIAAGLVVSCGPNGENQRVNQAYAHYRWAPRTIDIERWPHLVFDPSCAGKLFRRSFLIEHSVWFPQSFHEDQIFCLRTWATRARIAVAKSVVTYYVAPQRPASQTGTQTFSSEKLRQILLTGIFAVDSLKFHGAPDWLINRASSFLLMRYDRFLWKMAQAGEVLELNADLDSVFRRLYRFLVSLEEECISESARYYPEFFRLVLAGQFDDAVAAMANDASETPADPARETISPAYDYYRAVPLSALACEATGAVVNDMAYAYRLGSPFVNAVKSPGKAFLIPFKLASLGFDMVTRRGRDKQARRHAAIRANSPSMVYEYSRFIESTAAFQLGVAMIETLTHRPCKLRTLPHRLREIYRNTAS